MEGGDWLKDRFQWKEALGPAEQRPGHWNGAWHYWSTDGAAVECCRPLSARRVCSQLEPCLGHVLAPAAGLGLYEYMQLAEALHAEPVLVVNNGISHREAVPPEQVGPYLQVFASLTALCLASPTP